MSNIPTVEEILELHYNMDKDEDGHPIYYDWSAKDAMIAFARLHVEAALKAASENVKYREQITMQGVQRTFSVNSILNAYPLENIK